MDRKEYLKDILRRYIINSFVKINYNNKQDSADGDSIEKRKK